MDAKPPVEYVSIGPVTRDFHIAADGTLLFDVGGPGVLGGGGSYAMVSARLWSPSVGIVGRYTSTYPQDWTRQITAAGIDIEGLHVVQGIPAELVFGQYFPDGERETFDPRVVFPQNGLAVPEEMVRWAELGIEGQREVIRLLAPTVADIPPRYFEARAFHLAPMPYQCHLDLVDALRPYPMVRTLDPGPHYMGRVNAQDLTRLLGGVQVFMPSEGEVYSFFGAGAEMSDSARRLADFGPDIVAIKRSTRGSLVYERATGQLHQIPIYPARTVDATGAGDAYCGGFLVGYTETGSARRAGMYATISASFIVEGPGSLHALAVKPDAVQGRLRELQMRMQALADQLPQSH
jgi:ribokinase